MLPRPLAALIFPALASFALLAVPAAQAAETVHVRGTVEKLEGSTLTVKTREGPTDRLLLGQGWKISGVAKAAIGDIRPGDFVGVTSVTKAKGGNGALEVLIFPAALKGTREGSRPWDLKPKSTMTNGTVANAVKAVDGRTVTVSYHGQTKTITIPDGTPVVTLAPATAVDLKPGAAVFVVAEKAKNGKLSASRVVVGNHGVIPPM